MNTKLQAVLFMFGNYIVKLVLFLLPISLSSQSNLTGEEYLKISDSLFVIDIFESEKYMRKAANSYLIEGNHSKYIYCLLGIGGINFYEQNYKREEEILDSVIFLSNKFLEKNDPFLINVKNATAVFKSQLGDYNGAIEILEILLLNRITNKFTKSRILENLSLYLSKTGDYSISEDYAKMSLNLKIDTFGVIYPGVVDSYISLSKVQFKQSKFKEALENLEEGIRIYKLIHQYEKRDEELLKIDLLRIKNYQKLNLIDSVQKLLNVVETKNIIKYRTLYYNYLNIKSSYFDSIKKYDKTHSIINHALRKLSLEKESKFYKKEIYEFEFRKCQTLKNLFKDDEAIFCFENLQADLSYDNLTLKDIIVNKEILSLKLKKNIYAHFKMESVIHGFVELKNKIVSLRIQNSDASHRDFWANENLDIFEDAIETFIKFDEPEKAFEFAEENKSNLLLESINDFNAKGFANVPEAVLDREQSHRANLNFYKQELYKIEKDTTIEQSKIASLRELISKSQLNLDQIIDSLETNYPDYYNIKYNEESINVSDIQEMLGPNDLFLEYFVGKDSAFVFSITDSSYEVETIEDFNQLKDTIKIYFQMISDPLSDQNKLKELSNVIYDALIPYQDDEGLQNKKVIIVPDDLLNNLPFELLYDGNNFLSTNNSFQYQYSGKLWKMLKGRTQKKCDYDFVGYAYHRDQVDYLAERSCFEMEASNLLCSEKEIKNIVDQLSGKTNSIVHENKEELFEKSSSAKIIHLATHSCLDTENSDYSKIYFDDGYITNLDLQIKDIGAELAVVSGCESGYGEVVEGEGAMSISKGFFHAGCKSTLVSLWPVDDCSTADIMKYFYQFLSEGNSKDIALQEAKRKYLETAHPSQTHPYYWAGFVLMGDDKPIWGNFIPYQIFFIPIILVLSFLGFKIYKSRQAA